METVKMFRTTDGEVFEVLSDAEAHQNELDLRQLIDTQGIYAVGRGYLDAGDLIEWLIAHRDAVLKFYKGRE